MNPAIFSALAEPNRLHIVELLKDKPHSVNDIVNSLHLNQPQVSKHLKVLADSGLVGIRPVAQKRYYFLRPEPLKEIDRWIQKYRRLWEERFDRLEAMLKEENRILNSKKQAPKNK